MGLTEWDVQRAARFDDAEHRYDRGLPVGDDIDVSPYHEFAAGDRATEILVQMARDQAKAEAETRRNARQAAAELPDMEAEAG